MYVYFHNDMYLLILIAVWNIQVGEYDRNFLKLFASIICI